MRMRMLVMCAAFVVCGVLSTHAQGTQQTGAGAQSSSATSASEARVALDAEAIAFDAEGRAALAGRLRTTQLVGTPDAPVRNARIVVENRSAFFYTYASGWATFYDASGVRCGEGLWKLEALAPQESAEVETPGLRLTCTPSTWRIVATNLVTRTSDATKPPEGQATRAPEPEGATPASAALALPPLEININGKTLPIQPGNPLEITVGKERVRITVNPAP